MRRHLPVLLVLASCAASRPPADAPPDPCATLDGATFASAELQPGGLPPPGQPPIPMRWTLEFQRGAFTWIHTDIAESGPYTCENGLIRTRSPAGFHEARLVGDEIVWEGKRYVRTATPPAHEHEGHHAH